MMPPEICCFIDVNNKPDNRLTKQMMNCRTWTLCDGKSTQRSITF